MQIYRFEYNGFYGNSDESIVENYTVKFKEWTDDPGIFVGIRSDNGEKILVPTFALVNTKILLPEQPVTTTLFGKSSKSF